MKREAERDGTQAIADALVGKCSTCRGRGWIYIRNKVASVFGPYTDIFDTSVKNGIETCPSCNTTGDPVATRS